MPGKRIASGVSRRSFLAATAAAAAVASLPAVRPKAQTGGPWVRMSLTDPNVGSMIDSYNLAVTRLLALDPNDPRNFYRNAFIHTLDCPHGNWWFLPWHRGYLGWWEQTVRELSGNPNFAFPYWDWTVQPYVPDAFWNGALNPASTGSGYISSFSAFQATFTPAMTAFYNGLSAGQTAELQQRPTGVGTDTFATAQGFWNALPPMFFTPANARSLTAQSPYFDEYTQYCVSLGVIDSALASLQFADQPTGSSQPDPDAFGSLVASQHSESVGFGILEGLPHNNVHNNVGGFMGDFLSPIDPIFMAHHANIDRLWTVWTADQIERGLPTLPTGDLYTQWASEPFLFYINSAGQQVTQNTAGDYAEVGSFNYVYTPGTGDSQGSMASASPQDARTPVRRVSGTVKAAGTGYTSAAVAQLAVPKDALDRIAPARSGELYAHITIDPPAQTKNVRFHVLVNPPDTELSIDAHHPSYAGTFEFFGSMHHAHPVTFTVPLTQPVRKLRAAGALRSDQPLQIHVIPQTRGVALRAVPKVSVRRVEISAT